MNPVPATEKPLSRLQFRKIVGYPLVPICPKCGGVGNHLMKRGGFYCQIDHMSEDKIPKDKWIVMTLLMAPPIYQPVLFACDGNEKRGPIFKTTHEAEKWINAQPEPIHTEAS